MPRISVEKARETKEPATDSPVVRESEGEVTNPSEERADRHLDWEPTNRTSDLLGLS